MTDTMAQQAADRIQELADDIERHSQYFNYWQGVETAANARAGDLRRVKLGLTANIEPLVGIFNPIRTYHTANTWEGNAATASRERLGIHEDVLRGAQRNLEALIDDLQAELVIAEGEAGRAEEQAGRYSWLRYQAQNEKTALQRSH